MTCGRIVIHWNESCEVGTIGIKIGDCEMSISFMLRYTNIETTVFNKIRVNLFTASNKMVTHTVQNVAKDILMVALSFISIKIHLQ